jgi:hypothetical protein
MTAACRSPWWSVWCESLPEKFHADNRKAFLDSLYRIDGISVGYSFSPCDQCGIGSVARPADESMVGHPPAVMWCATAFSRPASLFRPSRRYSLGPDGAVLNLRPMPFVAKTTRGGCGRE